MSLKKSLIAVFCLCAVSVTAFSQSAEFDSDSVKISDYSSVESQSVLGDALNAYKKGDWETSIFLFKKLHSSPENVTPETLYMLIMAQTYSGLYKQAVVDCDLFIKKYPHNQYIQLVTYQKGKNLFHTNDFEKSILVLSDFCHTYPHHSLYSSALFWIAENFFASYNFDSAKSLYERIVTEFPDDIKARDAQYRLDIITQREREEKLLFLLKQTGEDYLSSRESYEKILKQYKVENTVGVNTQIRELREQNQNLNSDLENAKKRSAELEAQITDYEDNLSKSIRELKAQANDVLKLINQTEGK